MEHNGDFLNILVNLIAEIVGETYSISTENTIAAATEVIVQLIDLGVQITEQVVERVITFLSNIRQGTEWAYKKTKDAVYEIWECTKATAGFPGRLFESVVVFGVNCVLFCIGRITGKELIHQTRQSVDNIMNPDRKPLVGAAAGVVTGAAIGTVVPGIGILVGGLAGFIIGSFMGVTAARNT